MWLEHKLLNLRDKIKTSIPKHSSVILLLWVFIHSLSSQFDLCSTGVGDQPQPAAPPCRPPFFHALTERRHRHTLLPLEWQWNWISPGWLKHVGLCEPVSRVQVHHLSQSAGCVMYPGKWGCCGSADGAAPRWWKCIRWVFYFFLVRDREWRTGREREKRKKRTEAVMTWSVSRW